MASEAAVSTMTVAELKAEKATSKNMTRKLKIIRELSLREQRRDRAAFKAKDTLTLPSDGVAVEAVEGLDSNPDSELEIEEPNITHNWVAPTSYNTSSAKLVGQIAEQIAKSDRPLRNYQVVGAEFVVQQWLRHRGVMQGDDMGLGKTVQSLVALMADSVRHLESNPDYTVIFLTKKSLIDETAKALRSWVSYTDQQWMIMPLQSEVNQDKKMKKFQVDMALDMPVPGLRKMIVTNYESLNTFKWLMDKKWTIMVVDEAHKLKGGAQSNPTLIWKNAKQLSEQVDRFLFMSGTFINNGIEDLWAQLNIFNPEMFDNLAIFKRMFGLIGDGTIEIDVKKLVETMTPMMIRREMKDVNTELPPVQWLYHDAFYTDQQRKMQETLLSEFLLWVEAQGDHIPLNNMLEQLTAMRMLNLYPGHFTKNVKVRDSQGDVIDTITVDITWDRNGKLDAMTETMDDLLMSGEQIVVFSDFNAPLNYFVEYYRKLGFAVEMIDGKSNNSGKTKDYANDFQQGKINILCINKNAGAEGLNLQKCADWPGGASHAFFCDFWWNPARDNQCAARLHRINTISPVFCHRYLVDASVDQIMQTIANEKAKIIEAVGNADNFKLSKQSILHALGKD